MGQHEEKLLLPVFHQSSIIICSGVENAPHLYFQAREFVKKFKNKQKNPLREHKDPSSGEAVEHRSEHSFASSLSELALEPLWFVCLILCLA